MWLWYSLRARSLFYFSASNPSIPTGGMMGESKFDVLALLPPEVRPRCLLVRVPVRFNELQEKLTAHGIDYPFIAKPDVGERGWRVQRICNPAELKYYCEESESVPVDFIIQEFVSLPLEFGIFYERLPSRAKGRVTSVTAKEFLSVVGDGQSTLRELIADQPRARLHADNLSTRFRNELSHILPTGERKELESIGNHCRGTTFLDANHLITDGLHESFDRISKQVPGFYFGRYDLRCASLDDLQNGRVQVLELNGCGAEPAHIYHPGASLIAALRTLIRHWQVLFVISLENHQRGVPYLSLRDAWRYYRKARALQ